MFPSSGYFRSLTCPFYASGLCERPYCHFRHTRVEVERVSKTDNGPIYVTPGTSIYDNSRAYKGSTLSSSSPVISSTIVSLPSGSYGVSDGHIEADKTQGLSSFNTTNINDKVNEAESSWSIPSFSSPTPLLPASNPDIVEGIEALPKISGLPKSRKSLPFYVPTPKPPFTTSSVSSTSSVPSYNPTPKPGTDEGKKQSSRFIAYDLVKNFAFCDKARDSEEEEAKFSDDEGGEVVKNVHSTGLDESGESDLLETKVIDTASDSGPMSNNDDDLTDSDEDVSWKGALEKDSSGAKKKSQDLKDLLKPSSYFTDKHTTSEPSTKSKPDSHVKDLPSSSSAKSISSSKSNSEHSSKRSRSKSDADKSKTHPDSSSLKGSSKAVSKSCDRDIKHSSDKPSSSSSSFSKTSKTSLSLSSSTNKGDKRVHISSSSSSSSNKSHKSISDKKSSSSLVSSSSSSSHKSSSYSKSHRSTSSSHKSSSSKSSLTKHKSSSSSSSSAAAKHSGNHRKELHSTSIERHKSSLSKSSSSKHSHSSSSEKENKLLEKSQSSHSSHKSHSVSKSLSSKSSSSTHQDSNKNHLKDKTLDIKDKKLDIKDKKLDVKDKKCNSENHKDEKPRKEISKHSKGIHSLNHKYSENSVSKVNGIVDGVCNGTELKKERRTSDALKVPLIKDKEKKNQLESSSNKEFTGKIPNGGYDSDSDIEIVEPPPPPVYSISDSEDENVDSALQDGRSDEDDEDFPMPEDPELASFEECFKIFQEAERQLAAEKLKKGEAKHDPNKGKAHEVSEAFEASEDILASLGKKRMAHANSTKVSRPSKATTLPRPRLSAKEVMYNRIVEMQKRALLRAAKREGRESDLPSQLTDSSATPSSTQRGGTLSAAVSSSASSSALRPKSTAGTAASGSTTGSRQSFYVSPSLLPPSGGQKQRTAHAPKAALFPGQKTPPRRNSSAGGDAAAAATAGPAAAAKTALYSPNSFYKKGASSSLSAKTTVAGTASKTEKRKMHEPTLSNLKRPLIPAEFGGKVPTNFRQRYLNILIEEYLKFRPEEEAYTKAVEDEKEIYEKAANKKLYLGVAVNIVKRIRTEAAQALPSTSKKPCLESVSASGGHMAQSHAATLGGRNAVRHSYTLNRSKSISGSAPSKIEGKEFYERLKPYIMTEEQLRENGYPRSPEDGSSKAQFYKEESSEEEMLRANERVCRRCGKRFTVNKEGDPITKDICVYHYGGIFKKRIARNIERVYSCCSEREGVKGCQVASLHVHERNKKDNRTGYMKAIPDESSSSDKNNLVLALDCEMVYTKAGLELARVTVVGEDHKVVYESLVRPETEIVDYNTKFSGITAADMKGVSTTIRGVQAVMLSMISDKTILMGHSLESDLVALKLIHSTVVDTSIVFPHRLGKPYKRALRNLMMDHLQKIIQADDGGHDSKEDAVACMQLMQYKVKEDAKKEYRRF